MLLVRSSRCLVKQVEDQSKIGKIFVCAAGSKRLECAALGNCRAKWHQHIKKKDWTNS